MATTILQRFENMTNITDNEFFDESSKLFYLNEAKKEVIVFYIRAERNQPIGERRSLRVLDKVRKRVTSSQSFPSLGGARFVHLDINVPADLQEIINITLKTHSDGVFLKEILLNDIWKIDQSVLRFNDKTGYYTFLGVEGDGDEKIRLFVNYTGAQNVTIYYYKDPVPIASATETFTDIPSFLESAVYYGAAWLLSIQDQDQISGEFTQKRFYTELQQKMM